MLLDDFLDLSFFKVSDLILLHVQDNLGTTANTWPFSVELNGEASTGARLPNVLLVIIGLGDNLNLVGNQVCRVEPNTKLTYSP